MPYKGKLFLIFLLLICLKKISFSQCLIPSPDGDTLFPVINRISGYGDINFDHRREVSEIANSGNKVYIAGDFQNIGPNTGAGVIMNDLGSQVLTYKKWRINGPVFASVADGNGGYFIGGIFSKVGDSSRYNVAHINSKGEPTNWKADVNDLVKTIALYKDTLIIGGKFGLVNGQIRNAFAMLNVNTGNVLPAGNVNNLLKAKSLIHAFCLVDTILYVGAKYYGYNGVGAFFKVNVKSGFGQSFPEMYQMIEVFAVDVSQNKRRIYIGGTASGSLASSNGFCIDANTNALLFKIDIGIKNTPGAGALYSIRCHGANVYAGGDFNFGIIAGHNFEQKGMVVFDTATGIIRPYLNNCDGTVYSTHSKGNKVYVSGVFNSLGGETKANFAVFDTTLKTVANNSLNISDRVNTISFTGNNMFVGGSFHSVNCATRNGFAAFDINTGQILPWIPNIYATTVTDLKASGDTVFIAGSFGQVGNQFGLGGFVALNGTTGDYYSNTVKVDATCYDMLVDKDYLYVSGWNSFGISSLVKIYLPTLTNDKLWKPAISFQIKSIQKRNGHVYGLGDRRPEGVLAAYLTEINDTTGVVIRTINLGQSGMNWINTGVLAGNKFFFGGLFSSILNVPRSNIAVFDVDTWQLNPIDIKISSGIDPSDMQFKNGNVYLGGGFNGLNGKRHHYFAIIDTSVGAIFPDRLNLNDDYPYGYSFDDLSGVGSIKSFLFTNNSLVIGGDFRNINKAMFPTLAKLKLQAGAAPALPQGISGPDTISCPSQNNIYSITNSNPGYRYAWFTSGQDITIRNNGTDSVLIDVGPLAIPGVLKAVAITECGRSDTVYRTINIKTTEPTVNASNLILVRKTDTTATIRFTRGNGARRIVVLRAINPITDLPQDFQEYIADPNLGAGSNLGNNSFVVYKGNGDSVAIKKLNPGTIYYVTVFEFNGLGINTNYLTSGNPSLSFTTLATLPSLQASNIVFTNVTQTGVTIACTPGNGSGRLIVMRLHSTLKINPVNTTTYSSSSVYGSGSDLGSGNFVVSNSTSPVTISNLQPNTFYDVIVFEYNGSGQSINYLTVNAPSNGVRTMAIEPGIQASNIIVSQVTPTTCTINCTPGNGQYRLVVMRKDSAVTFIPQDSVFYGWGSSNAAFGSGTDLGNNTYVLNAATPVNVSNLIPRTKYHIAIFEFNGSLWNNNYITTSAPVASFTTPDNTPTIQASNLTVSSITTTKATANCTSGNGSNRLFVIREGSPVIDTPVNGKNYPIGTGAFGGTNIGNHTYVLARQQPVNISSLSPGKTYYLKVFEYNGSGASLSYLTKDAPSISFTTADIGSTVEPSQQASNIAISGITTNAATVNCTPGNGQNRLVVIRQGASLSSKPSDGKSYNANSIFGNGDTLSSNTFVISNTSVPITVTGLSPQTEYTVSVFEFNGSDSLTNYLTSGSVISRFKTLANKPTIASSNITISALNATSATINCTRGNGQSRLVVIKQGASITANPSDGVLYNSHPVYGLGTNMGDQTFAIDTTTPVTVTGLLPQTTYTVMIFEYNGFSSTASYLTANAPTSTFLTTVNLATEPSQQAAGILISGISANAATINCTQGNGENRLVVIRQGANLSSAPSDGNTYTSNTTIGNGSDIGNNTYVISNTSTPVLVTGLQPQTEYAVSIFEFKGAGSQINYLTSGNVVATFKTLANRPTTPASNIVISGISSTSATIHSTPGNGQSRLVVIKQGTNITAEPSDGSGYTGNAIYGTGVNIGDQTFVITDTTTPSTVTGLQPQTSYTVKVFEFNGSGNTASYLVSNSPSSTFTTNIVTSVIDLNLTGTTLKIFPNPVTDQNLSILFETPKRGDLIITIYSIQGARLFSQSYPIRTNRTNLNVHLPINIPSGLIIVKCSFLGKSGSTLLNKF